MIFERWHMGHKENLNIKENKKTKNERFTFLFDTLYIKRFESFDVKNQNQCRATGIYVAFFNVNFLRELVCIYFQRGNFSQSRGSKIPKFASAPSNRDGNFLDTYHVSTLKIFLCLRHCKAKHMLDDMFPLKHQLLRNYQNLSKWHTCGPRRHLYSVPFLFLTSLSSLEIKKILKSK